jgi:hypothetical protein
MKQKIKKWTFRILVTGLLLVGILLTFILSPTLLYANKTRFGNYTIYYNTSLDTNFKKRLNEATELLNPSEIYNPKLHIDICLNDGSSYPALIQFFLGSAFGIGFYDKVVLMGSINWKDNYEIYNGYKWNLTQLIAHETLHCLQFNKFGLLKSNPVAKYPTWKWEGYNEYIARRNNDQLNLIENINRYNEAALKTKDDWGIKFADSTYVGKYYYKWWILMQYCKDIKKMTYLEILQDTTREEIVSEDMINWYNQITGR